MEENEPSEDEVRAWHRRFAASRFNATWDLIDSADRTPDDELEMLLSAATSRWHWDQIGGPDERATGDWQVGHVLSLMGYGDLAARFARRNLAVAEAEGWDGWKLASAHEGVARALAASGDKAGRDEHVGKANAALARETDQEDRDWIASQIASVPEV